ncbi:hypothetical protein M5K25_013659 [Dendrobium thyrsiflorum]|uniref:Uncharacterized protein n=1 Tax=Dendrobium thyrsiflorum TaxID=117978 RepID=A0ABD0V1F0_DENTH
MVSVLPWSFGIGFSFDADSLRHIRTECERAKDALYLGSGTAEVKIQRLGMEVRTSINREWLVQMNLDHLRSGILRCLTEAGVRQDAVDEVVLAGASSTIPAVLRVLLEFFQRQLIRFDIDLANLMSLSNVANTLNIPVVFRLSI